MRSIARLLAAFTLFVPSLAHAYVLISTVAPVTAGFVYPSAITFTPSTVTIPIGPQGTVIATASVTNSDGSPFAGTLSVTGDPLLTVQGMNIVLARASTAADQNQPHAISVVATEPTSAPPSAAIALNPSAGTIPCDVGPPVNAIPPEAQAAGFTTCAMNLDFSQPIYQNLTDWANPDLWSNPGPNPNLLFYSDSLGIQFFNPQSISQVYDPAAGQNVELFHWDPINNGNLGCAWQAGGQPCQADQVGVATWNASANNFSGAFTWSVGNYYMEDEVRMQHIDNVGSNTSGPIDVYMYSQSDPYHEADAPEFQGNQFNDLEGASSGVVGIYFHNNNPCDAYASTNWDNTPCQFQGVPGYTNLAYYKYGVMRTSDGKTDTRFCGFLNDLMQGQSCGPGFGDKNVIDMNFTDRSALLISAGANGGLTPKPIDFLVKRVTIWSCADYKTSMCNGTSLATATNNGQTETYYH